MRESLITLDGLHKKGNGFTPFENSVVTVKNSSASYKLT